MLGFCAVILYLVVEILKLMRTSVRSGQTLSIRRRRGLVVLTVVERRTPEREVGGSILIQVAVLYP